MLDTKGCRGQLMNIAQRLLSIDSPSGFTDQVVREAEQIARDHGYAVRRTNKGNLVVSVPGREKGKRVGLCAHIDTLGLMVRSITADGMLMTTRIGGPILPTLDGEDCRIHTRDGRPTGSTQTDRIRLPYTAPEASRRAFFVKELWTPLPDCQGKERERNLPRTILDRQHLETRHDAMDQLRFQSEPHIFIHIQVLVPILVLHRSGGKSPDVLLIVSDHGGKGVLVAAYGCQDHRHRNRLHLSGHSNPSFIRYSRNSFSVTSRRLDTV